MISSKRCYKCRDEHFTTCTPDIETCTVCSGGYTADKGNCLCTVSNCLKCDNNPST